MIWLKGLSAMPKQRKILFGVAVVVLLFLIFIGSIGSFQTFGKQDVSFDTLEWLLHTKKAPVEDLEQFCSECGSAGNCDLRLKFGVKIPTREAWDAWPFEREYHCVKIINGVNYYDKEETYFGILGNSVESFEYLDARQSHEVELCCGVETSDMIQQGQLLLGIFSEDRKSVV